MAERDLGQRRSADVEKLLVLSQPHRKGNPSQLCESPLGQLILRRGLRPELFEAGREYARLINSYRMSICAPKSRPAIPKIALMDGGMAGSPRPDPEPEQVMRLMRFIGKVELPLNGSKALLRDLCLEERPLPPNAEDDAIAGLLEVAVTFGLMLRRLGPFIGDEAKLVQADAHIRRWRRFRRDRRLATYRDDDGRTPKP